VRINVVGGIALLAVVVVVSLAGCGDEKPVSRVPTAPSSPALSGVRGHVLEEGGPPPIDNPGPRVLPNVTVEVHEGSLNGPIVATAKAAADGSFEAALPPGRYTLTVREYDDRLRLPATVTVESGQWVTVMLVTMVK